MLKTYINAVPYTKFVLIEDSLENRGRQILDYAVLQHIKEQQHRICYFTFEGCFKRTQNSLSNVQNITLYDYISNGRNWAEAELKHKSFKDVINGVVGDKTIIIIDSLASVILRYGLAESYRILNTLKNNTGILQIITILHKDLLENDANSTIKYLEHLSTLTLSLESEFLNSLKRIQYVYKKAGGKIIREVEEFKFLNDELITQKIEKIDLQKFIETSVPKEPNPENLSTFKIGLTNDEKMSRDKLILPYLPKTEETTGGKVIYKFEDTDDWDEEDPDDDLDI